MRPDQPAWLFFLAAMAADATHAQSGAAFMGDVPACAPIVGRACPARDPPDGLGDGKGPCDEVAPVAVRGRCRARKAGCAGLTRGLCADVCGYCRSLVEASLCRMTSFADDPNEACGHRGMQLEWEPVALEAGATAAPVPVVLTGRAALDGASGCMDAPTCLGCAAPRYSALDNCYTHDDRDFVLDLAVGEEALSFLSPANMVADSAHAGRDLDVEAEWMYLFAPYHGAWLFAPGDARRARPRVLPALLSWTGADRVQHELGVPAPGDPVAVAGVLAADCGHLNARGFPRTEVHPALALSWLHDEGGGRFSLWVRAMSHAQGDRRRFSLGTLRAALPLPGGARVTSFRWDYLWRNYHVEVDGSCEGNDGDHPQERPTAHLSDVDPSEVVRLNRKSERPEALHESRWYAIRVTAAGASVEIEVRSKADEDPPVLVGARAGIELR